MKDINLVLFVVVASLIGLAILWFIYRKNFKTIVVNCIALFTGAPKTGKDAICCMKAQFDYRNAHHVWWWRKQFQKLFKKPISEEPLFYTNAVMSFHSLKRKKPHRYDKNIRFMSLAALLREKRFAYKSVGWITEASLVADNMFFNDQEKNIQLSLFAKLFSHETRGGKLYLSTQNPQDLHYSFKRVCSNFWFLQKSINVMNLFLIVYCREMVSNDLGSNNFVDDVDTTTRKVIVPFWYFKRYDRYQFSVLTDDLEVDNQYLDKDNIVQSFNSKYNEYAYAKKMLDQKVAKEKAANEQKENNKHAC